MSEDSSENNSMALIKRFRLTDRSPQETLNYLHLSTSEIENLPQKATVIEVGSGTTQEMARFFKKLRPDINFLSLDPTLSFRNDGQGNLQVGQPKNPSEDHYEVYLSPDGTNRLEYGLIGEYPSSTTPEGLAIHNKRVKHSAEAGGIAALAPNLPIKADSADLVIDSFGPGTWYCADAVDTQAYFTELHRVLKPGAKAIVYPVDSASDFMDHKDPKQRFQIAKARFSDSVSPDLLSAQFYEQDFTSRSTGTTTHRLGVIVQKPNRS